MENEYERLKEQRARIEAEQATAEQRELQHLRQSDVDARRLLQLAIPYIRRVDTVYEDIDAFLHPPAEAAAVSETETEIPLEEQALRLVIAEAKETNWTETEIRDAFNCAGHAVISDSQIVGVAHRLAILLAEAVKEGK